MSGHRNRGEMVGVQTPRYLVLEDACRKYDIESSHLTRAVEHGIVRAVRVNGHIAVAEEDVRKLRDANGEPVAELPRYIPLPEAVRRYGISEEVLKRAIESGTIEAIQLDEEVAVAEGDVEKIASQQRIEIHREEFEKWRGERITITQAAEEYDLPHSTISRWVKAGYINVLGRQGRRVFIDKADVAYCVAVYRHLGGKRGTRIFDKDGKPYQLRHPERAKEPKPLLIIQ